MKYRIFRIYDWHVYYETWCSEHHRVEKGEAWNTDGYVTAMELIDD